VFNGANTLWATTCSIESVLGLHSSFQYKHKSEQTIGEKLTCLIPGTTQCVFSVSKIPKKQEAFTV